VLDAGWCWREGDWGIFGFGVGYISE
jgi:hypothetical protein